MKKAFYLILTIFFNVMSAAEHRVSSLTDDINFSLEDSLLEQKKIEAIAKEDNNVIDLHHERIKNFLELIDVDNPNVEKLSQLEIERFNVNLQDNHLRSALHYAILGDHKYAINYLLHSKNINLALEDVEGFTCLSLAVEKNDIELVKILLKLADENSKRDMLNSRSLKNKRYILSKGQRDFVDFIKKSDNEKKLIKELIEQVKEAQKLFQRAVKSKNEVLRNNSDWRRNAGGDLELETLPVEALKFRLEARIQSQNIKRLNKEAEAKHNLAIELRRMAYRSICEFRKYSKFIGLTPLALAVIQENKEMVKLLLSNGANPRIKIVDVDDQGVLKVDVEAYNIDGNLCKLANKLNKKTCLKYLEKAIPFWSSGEHTFITAISEGQIALINLLLQNSCIDICDSFLHRIIASDNRIWKIDEIVKILLSHKADPNALCFREYPLEIAVKRNATSIAKVLIDAKADANACCYLDVAINNNNCEMFKLLLEANSDHEIMTNSAMEWALKIDNQEIVDLLIARGCSIEKILNHQYPWNQNTFKSLKESLADSDTDGHESDDDIEIDQEADDFGLLRDKNEDSKKNDFNVDSEDSGDE